jgi:FMN phosphatase YigB (HAD superfamily)
MKFIFDFDDVLFRSTKHRKEHLFVLLEKAGISHEKLDEYYKEAREVGFSLRDLLKHFSLGDDLYKELMSESKNYIDTDLHELIKKLGKDNCYIVTFGDKEFNSDKIFYSGTADLFHKENIFIVQGGKKEFIEEICKKHQNEEVVFIDDKAYHFKDLDFIKYPNLKTILYDEKGLEKITSLLSKS